MRAYWFAKSDADQRDPHDSGQAVDVEYLSKLGVLCFRFSNVADVAKLAADRGYKNRDLITVSPSSLGDAYEQKVKTFFKEHLHEDEEIRYIREGTGYFDVRSADDEWVRIQLDKDDMIILPAGIYHRFTTDNSNHVVAMRLFKEDPKWTPLNRGPDIDENHFRKDYIRAIGRRSI